MISIPMNPGETYLGVSLNDNNQPLFRVIKIPGCIENVNFEEALSWARSNKADLPDPDELSMYSILNKKHIFWTSEVDERTENLILAYHPLTTRFAKTDRKLKGAAIAVRRIPVN